MPDVRWPWSVMLNAMSSRLRTAAAAAFLALLGLSPSACAPEPASDLLTVCGYDSHLRANVELDGVVVGQLSPLNAPGPLLKALLPRSYADSPMATMVALNVPIDAGRMPHGLHKVRLALAGQPSLEVAFRYPFTGPDRHCLVFASSADFAVSDSCSSASPAPIAASARPAAPS